jgi:hypothetical protein
MYLRTHTEDEPDRLFVKTLHLYAIYFVQLQRDDQNSA